MSEEKVSPLDKIQILGAIFREIEKGNIEFAEELKRDALQFLKEENMETEWLRDMMKDD